MKGSNKVGRVSSDANSARVRINLLYSSFYLYHQQIYIMAGFVLGTGSGVLTSAMVYYTLSTSLHRETAEVQHQYVFLPSSSVSRIDIILGYTTLLVFSIVPSTKSLLQPHLP
jgi:hypothetical protein